MEKYTIPEKLESAEWYKGLKLMQGDIVLRTYRINWPSEFLPGLYQLLECAHRHLRNMGFSDLNFQIDENFKATPKCPFIQEVPFLTPAKLMRLIEGIKHNTISVTIAGKEYKVDAQKVDKFLKSLE